MDIIKSFLSVGNIYLAAYVVLFIVSESARQPLEQSFLKVLVPSFISVFTYTLVIVFAVAPVLLILTVIYTFLLKFKYKRRLNSLTYFMLITPLVVILYGLYILFG